MFCLHTSSPRREEREFQHLYEGVMKDKSGLIVSALLMLFGVYALLTTLRSGEKEVTLIGNIPISWGLALMFGLIGLFVGGIVLMTALSKRRLAA